MIKSLTTGHMKARFALLATFTSLFVFVPVINSGAAPAQANVQINVASLLSNSSTLYVVMPTATPAP